MMLLTQVTYTCTRPVNGGIVQVQFVLVQKLGVRKVSIETIVPSSRESGFERSVLNLVSALRGYPRCINDAADEFLPFRLNQVESSSTTVESG